MTTSGSSGTGADSSGFRGEFPSATPTTRRIAEGLSLPACERRRVLDSEGIDLRKLSRLLTQDNGQQSPFLIRRTQQFERRVLSNGMADVIDLARRELDLRIEEVKQSVIDAASIRDAVPGLTPDQVDRQRADRTAAYLRDMLTQPSVAVNLLQKPLIRLRLGGREVLVEQDLMVCAAANETVHLVDIESFAEIDGYLDPEQVGQTMAACAVAVISLRQMATTMGVDPKRISDRMLLVTPSQTGFTPVGRLLNLSHHIARLEVLIDNLDRLCDANGLADELGATGAPGANLPAMPLTPGTDDWAAAERRAWEAISPLATHLTEACMSCPMFRACRREAQTTRSVTVLGTGAAQEAGGVFSVTRSIELANGATPASPAEAGIAAALVRARLATEAAMRTVAVAPANEAESEDVEDEGGAVS